MIVKMKRLITLLLMLLLISVSAGAMPDDFIAAWDFESFTDGKVTDISANGFHGVINKPSVMTVRPGASINGSSALEAAATSEMDNKMTAPGLGALISTKKALTISGWFKYEGTFDKERYFFNVPNTVGNAGFAASVLTDRKVKLQIRNAEDKLQALTTATAPVVAGEWFHYTFVVQLPETASGRGTLIIYINGEEVAKDTNINTAGLTTLSSLGHSNVNDDFRLGAQGSYTFIGSSDDVKVFGRAVTAQEAKNLSRLNDPTVLEEFKIGEVDMLGLENIDVSSPKEQGATYFSNKFPLRGVQIRFSENSKQRISTLTVNGVEVPKENYGDLQINMNDVVVFEYQGDEWEGNDIYYYKVTVKGEGIIFSDIGFYDGQERLTSIKPGSITAKATVSSSYEEESEVILIAIKRDAKSKLIKGIYMDAAQVKAAQNAQPSVQINVSGEESCVLELYFVDSAFKAFSQVLTLAGE
jgi:hypothetical protein